MSQFVLKRNEVEAGARLTVEDQTVDSQRVWDLLVTCASYSQCRSQSVTTSEIALTIGPMLTGHREPRK